ncbi:S8 family serine peptidase [Tumebacillus flagellatus]|uniref:S8 family serine peptidase n=1 Tax=Tumebacillus flagellatus TaxID=1157490 RepID=UPI002378040A|nr:S8 family serine peptidase [Tumebacillus flagellatus]
MKKKKVAKATSLALASALLVGGIPFQSAASASTVESLATHIDHSKFNASTVTATGVAGQTASAYISPKLDTDSDDLVSVIVTLTNQPVAVGQYALKNGNSALAAESSESAIASQQTSVASKAASLGINMSVQRQYNTVLNGMAVTLPASQIPKLATVPGVKSVFENRTYYNIPDAEADNSDKAFDAVPLKQIGADKAWEKGFTGKGLKVGVIDTGIDYLHPDLKGAYKGGYNAKTHTTDPYEDIPNAKLKLDGTEHGTHVSGTIAGRAANSTSEIVQKGIAYEAELYSYKVLGYDPATGKSSGSSAEVIDGIEHAVKDGMNVINLSLGSDGEKDPNSPDAIAINNAVLSGVIAVIANGNAATNVPGQYYYSNGSPASSQLAISVGAASSTSTHMTAKATDTVTTDVTHQLNVMSWVPFHDDLAPELGSDPIDAVYVGVGDTQDYKGKDMTGKIAFISRGKLTFDQKVKNAKAAGAKAAVIFNGNATAAGVPILDEGNPALVSRDGNVGANGYLADGYDYVPAFDMSGKEGREIARQLLANPDKTLKLSLTDIVKTSERGDTMASFSSRGPLAGGNYDIKPDLVAPGVNVMSSLPAYGKANPGVSYNEAYGRMSGTSMATPHVAGMALLVKQAHPDWTPFDVRAALANTATEISNLNGVQYDVYSQGAGRTNVDLAIDTPAVLETVDNITILDKNLTKQNIINYNDNASFGLMKAGDDVKTEKLQVKNTSDEKLTYTASIVMHPNVTSDILHPVATPNVNDIDVSLSGLTDGSLLVPAGTTAPFALNVAPKAGAADGVYEGEVLLQAEGKPSLHLPFVVNVGQGVPSGFGLQDIKLTNETISPNGDGIKDSTDLTVNLSADDVNYLDVEVFGLDDKFIGTMLVKTNKQDQNGEYPMFQPGLIQLGPLTDKYYDAKGNLKTLAPGTYKIAVWGTQIDKDGELVLDNNGNLVASYDVWHSFGITNNSTAQETVVAAAESFQANVTNITAINQPVLTLPETAGLKYAVTASSNPTLISNDGVLKSLPKAGNATVDLTVTVSSATDPKVKSTARATVTLTAVSPKPLYVKANKLDRTFGLRASVKVQDSPFLETPSNYNGNIVVVFQLMKGNTPIAITAVNGVHLDEEVVAQFPSAAGSDYWIKVSASDSLTGNLTDVGNAVAETQVLK